MLIVFPVGVNGTSLAFWSSSPPPPGGKSAHSTSPVMVVIKTWSSVSTPGAGSIFKGVTASSSMANSPILFMVTSPPTATGVGSLAALPTKINPSAKVEVVVIVLKSTSLPPVMAKVLPVNERV